jgi:AcrR family transcriptional regulator
MVGVNSGNGRKTGTRTVARVSRTAPIRRASGQATPLERLIASMIEMVGEQGYASTTVAHVIARAGASRRTFYEHFSDRQACLLMASEEIEAHWLERAVAAVDDAQDGRDAPIEAFVGELFQAALDSPDALRLLVAELAAAGQPGIERRERVFAELAETLCRALDEQREDADGMGSEHDSLLARALIGGVLRVCYARVLSGTRVRRPRRRALLALVPDVARWAMTYHRSLTSSPAPTGDVPPVGGRAPGTLSLSARGNERRGLSRGESTLSHSFVVHSQRERLLDAVANLSARKGFDSVTIPDLVDEAAVSVQAFYEHFSGRDDALLVAYEVGHRKALAITELAYDAQQDWPAAVSAATATLLGFYASEPSFAHLALVDAPAAGGKLASVAIRSAVAYAELLRAGLDRKPERERIGDIAVEASAYAVQELCYIYAATRRASELLSLREMATHIALTPFLAPAPAD